MSVQDDSVAPPLRRDSDYARFVRVELLLQQTSDGIKRLADLVDGDGRNGLMPRMQRVETDLLRLEHTVDKLSKSYFGNGTPGALDRIADIERLLGSLSRVVNAIVVPLALSFTAGLVAFVWALITHSIAIVPK